MADKNLKLYGSQGQQRLAVLTLKLSEIEIFKQYKGSTPILLLDKSKALTYSNLARSSDTMMLNVK